MLEEDYAAKLDAEGLRLLAVIRKSSLRMGCSLTPAGILQAGAQDAGSLGVDMTTLAREVWAELGASATAQFTIGALPSRMATLRCSGRSGLTCCPTR